MSVKHIALVLDHLDAHPSMKLVALILADHADSDGICWPSYRRIAQRSCLSERAVRRHVHQLLDEGLLVKLRTGYVTTENGQHRRITNAYQLKAEAFEKRPSLLVELSTGSLLMVDTHDHLQMTPVTKVGGRP